MTRGGTPTAMPPTTNAPTLTAEDLSALVRCDAGTRMLTVYLDTRVVDPAMRHAWRPALAAALRDVRATVRDVGELADFDRAAGILEHEARSLGGAWGSPGWVAFLTPDGVRYVGGVPVRVATLVAWRHGPVISPYLRVLKQRCPTVVALVDSRSARLFRYVWGALTALPAIPLASDDAASLERTAHGASRAGSTPPRGPLDRERVRHRQQARFRRSLGALSASVGELAGDDAWVLVGGTREWAHLAAESLSAQFPGRTLFAESLDCATNGETIATAARQAASRLRAARGRGRLEQLFERALPHGKAAVGIAATQRALHEQAVDLLFLTPQFLQRHGREAEDAVHDAVGQGAEIDVLSAGAAAHLDDVAEGIAARLRFALDGPVLHDADPDEVRIGSAPIAARAG